ncbi:MAG: hypothetical protein JWM57_2237 [Phycisphaerales bacterium]|nr:hypothetical protein [Phycisphaerales bacterium]
MSSGGTSLFAAAMLREIRRYDGRAMKRWIPLSVLALLLLTWPLTYWYTSLGIDSDVAQGNDVVSTYYRVRWPGQGIMMVGYVIERVPAHGKPIEPFDLGGTFLQPTRAAPPVTFANRLGFWWVNVDRTHDDANSPMAPRAERAVLVGFPHWLLVVVAGAWWLSVIRFSKRERPTPGTPATME